MAEIAIAKVLYTILMVIAGVIVAADAYRNIHEMDRSTRHSVRASYVLICLGAIVLVASMLPPLRAALLAGAALLMTGVAGLVLFNRRRVFERSPANELYVVGADDLTRTVQRRRA